MRWDHIIKNGTLVTSDGEKRAHIYIKSGKIVAVTSEALEGQAEVITDATGKHVYPGFIDTHVHSRDPGTTYKEDFYHSTLAAAAGGITSVFEMPNTNPPINTVENFNKQVKNLSSKANVNFAIWGICLGDLNLKELPALSKAGVIAFKFFWGYAVNRQTYQLVYNYSDDMQDVIPPFSDGEVHDMFAAVARTGKLLAIHAENNELIQTLTHKMIATGRTDYNALVEARPNLAEETTAQTGISFAQDTGTHLHILHISSGGTVDQLLEAQQKGITVTGETCPHYLFLNNEDYEAIGTDMKVYPPVKYKKDQERLWQGLQDGTISWVCSDHAPHTPEEKAGDLWSIPAGMCGVETLAPLMIHAVSEGKLTKGQLAQVLAENPAKTFNLYPNKGSLEVGSDADLTIVDFNQAFKIKREHLHSKSKVTAYDGFMTQGAPVQTIVNGHTVMKDGQIIKTHSGQFFTATDH
ncbi:allantoinase [Pullulanibacillus camelliae]|uniref:allantoinase n=1 Tax=Pullulanibacillus camelliae TaxID=1707096 RepID=A0A8J2YF09_9BACL|nr:allantoinase AllB [Pullulanibacillus camelliae]GGE27514.1 allantoinase [Pullulanibacillus camelliae]